LDPRTKIAAATGAAFCFSFVRTVPMACLCLAAALVLAFVAERGLPAAPFWKRLGAANVFILFIWLTVPFTMRGTGEGIRLALLVTLKANAILLSFLALVSGISLPRVGCALERLRVPAKLVFLFLFTCRYIHVVGEEMSRLRTAATLRGFVPRNSLHTYRTIGNMLGLTFVNAIDRSKRVYESMLLRGFNGRFHTATELHSSPADKVFAGGFFLSLAGILLLDIFRVFE
jgi:cobalt/nickel transport system permease protein